MELWKEQVGLDCLHVDLILSGSGVGKLQSWVLTEPRWSWPTLALLEAVQFGKIVLQSNLHAIRSNHLTL